MVNKILLVSPHLDDAILSAGQHMAGRSDNVVVTVFAGTPDGGEKISTPYDRKCGFDEAAGAMSNRRYENDNATALLYAEPINLSFTDGQYGKKWPTEQITSAIQNIIDANTFDYILGPLGLGHPDHLQTTEAILGLETELPIYLWEDLPLRVVEPELVFERLRELNITEKASLTAGEITRKVRALTCYSSQIGTGILDPYLLYVPERFWKL